MATQLFGAIRKGDEARALATLAGEPGLANARDDSGVSAILCALYNGRGALIEPLIAAGAAIGLYEAAALGRRDDVERLLVREPAAVGSYSPDGWTPLHLASFFGHGEVVALLLERGAPVNAVSRNAQVNTALNAAAAAGRTEIALLLLKSGADPAFRQAGGFTPLHAAAFRGDNVMLRALLDSGADQAAKTDAQQTALDLALAKGHQATVAILETAESAG
jgi:ankyrin repeat protein